MAYTHTTFAQASTQLSEQINDTGGIFWTSAERTAALNEALRTWGALTGYWRERGKFTTSANNPFYNVTTQAELSTLTGPTLTCTDLLLDIQYHLIEPLGVPWVGTEQFTLPMIQSAMQRALNQLMADTGVTLDHSTQVVAGAPDGRVDVDQTIVQIRRAAWRDGSGNYTVMRETDERSQRSANPLWEQDPDIPRAYALISTPVLTLQLGPPPAASGTLDLITIVSGPTLDLTAGTVLDIQDDYCWVVKWLTLYFLLSQDGPARDPERAKYCKQLYDLGVRAIQTQSIIRTVEINGVQKSLPSLFEFDAANRNWQGVTGTPNRVATLGDFVALSPVPDGAYSVTIDIVRKAPVAEAFIQVAPEHLASIVGYAQHLLSFKQAGTEFQATMGLAKQFLDEAGIYNKNLESASPFAEEIQDTATRDDKMRPTLYGAIQSQGT